MAKQRSAKRPTSESQAEFPSVQGPTALLIEDSLPLDGGEIPLLQLGEAIARLQARGDALLALAAPERCVEAAAAVATRKRVLLISGVILMAVGLLLSLPRLGVPHLDLPGIVIAFVVGPILAIWGVISLRSGLRLVPLTVDRTGVRGGRLPHAVAFDQIERAGLVLQGERSALTLQVGVRFVQSSCTSEVPILALGLRLAKERIPTMVVWHADCASNDRHAATWTILFESADEEGTGAFPPLHEADRIRSARERIDPMEGFAPE